MANETPNAVPATSESFNSAAKVFTIASDVLKDVQQHIGTSKIRSLRLTLGGRPIRDFPVSPATAVVSVLLVILAVIVTNLRVEVIKDMDVNGDADKGAPSAPAPGGAK